MQNNKSIFIVRIVATVTAAIALYSLPGLLKFIWWELSYSPQRAGAVCSGFAGPFE